MRGAPGSACRGREPSPPGAALPSSPRGAPAPSPALPGLPPFIPAGPQPAKGPASSARAPRGAEGTRPPPARGRPHYPGNRGTRGALPPRLAALLSAPQAAARRRRRRRRGRRQAAAAPRLPPAARARRGGTGADPAPPRCRCPPRSRSRYLGAAEGLRTLPEELGALGPPAGAQTRGEIQSLPPARSLPSARSSLRVASLASLFLFTDFCSAVFSGRAECESAFCLSRALTSFCVYYCTTKPLSVTTPSTKSLGGAQLL